VKLLFLSLLLANALMFVWTRWFESPPVPPAANRVAAPTLTLASELPPRTETSLVELDDGAAVDPIPADAAPQPAGLADDRATAGAVSPEDAAPVVGGGNGEVEPTAARDEAVRVADAADLTAPLMCLSLGPFRIESEAGNAAARLEAEGLAPRQRNAEGVVGGGYWVHLPPYPTRADARRAVAEINEKGVPDAYIVRTGEDINAIALGMLTELDRAQRLATQVRAIGFDAQIAERTLTDTVFWVDVDVDNLTRVDPTAFQSSSRRVARLRVENCPGPDAAALD